jgi:hypothetical protein
MAPRTFRLKLLQEGREFEAEGDKAFVLEMLKLYGPESQPRGTEPVAGDKKLRKGQALVKPTTGKSLSIREFIQRLDLTKHTDITLAFGYYLEKHQGVTEFTSADINNCYYEAKLESSNTSQMIVQNIKRGFLMSSKNKGETDKNRYTLTRTGEKYVETKLQGTPSA